MVRQKKAKGRGRGGAVKARRNETVCDRKSRGRGQFQFDPQEFRREKEAGETSDPTDEEVYLVDPIDGTPIMENPVNQQQLEEGEILDEDDGLIVSVSSGSIDHSIDHDIDRVISEAYNNLPETSTKHVTTVVDEYDDTRALEAQRTSILKHLDEHSGPKARRRSPITKGRSPNKTRNGSRETTTRSRYGDTRDRRRTSRDRGQRTTRFSDHPYRSTQHGSGRSSRATSRTDTNASDLNKAPQRFVLSPPPMAPSLTPPPSTSIAPVSQNKSNNATSFAINNKMKSPLLPTPLITNLSRPTASHMNAIYSGISPVPPPMPKDPSFLPPFHQLAYPLPSTYPTYFQNGLTTDSHTSPPQYFPPPPPVAPPPPQPTKSHSSWSLEVENFLHKKTNPSQLQDNYDPIEMDLASPATVVITDDEQDRRRSASGDELLENMRKSLLEQHNKKKVQRRSIPSEELNNIIENKTKGHDMTNRLKDVQAEIKEVDDVMKSCQSALDEYTHRYENLKKEIQRTVKVMEKERRKCEDALERKIKLVCAAKLLKSRMKKKKLADTRESLGDLDKQVSLEVKAVKDMLHKSKGIVFEESCEDVPNNLISRSSSCESIDSLYNDDENAPVPAPVDIPLQRKRGNSPVEGLPDSSSIQPATKKANQAAQRPAANSQEFNDLQINGQLFLGNPETASTAYQLHDNQQHSAPSISKSVAIIKPVEPQENVAKNFRNESLQNVDAPPLILPIRTPVINGFALEQLPILRNFPHKQLMQFSFANQLQFPKKHEQYPRYITQKEGRMCDDHLNNTIPYGIGIRTNYCTKEPDYGYQNTEDFQDYPTTKELDSGNQLSTEVEVNEASPSSSQGSVNLEEELDESALRKKLLEGINLERRNNVSTEGVTTANAEPDDEEAFHYEPSSPNYEPTSPSYEPTSPNYATFMEDMSVNVMNEYPPEEIVRENARDDDYMDLQQDNCGYEPGSPSYQRNDSDDSMNHVEDNTKSALCVELAKWLFSRMSEKMDGGDQPFCYVEESSGSCIQNHCYYRHRFMPPFEQSTQESEQTPSQRVPSTKLNEDAEAAIRNFLREWVCSDGGSRLDLELIPSHLEKPTVGKLLDGWVEDRFRGGSLEDYRNKMEKSIRNQMNRLNGFV